MIERLEIKTAIGVDDAGTITGIAWPFGSPDRVGDVIQQGAFGKIKLPITMLAFHDPDKPVGTWVEAFESEAGLEVKGRLLIGEVGRADEMRALVRAGAVTGLSIGFETKAATPRTGTRGRTITALDLVEISLVTIPCHPGARVRSAKSGAAAIRLAEAIQRATAALRSQ